MCSVVRSYNNTTSAISYEKLDERKSKSTLQYSIIVQRPCRNCIYYRYDTDPRGYTIGRWLIHVSSGNVFPITGNVSSLFRCRVDTKGTKSIPISPLLKSDLSVTADRTVGNASPTVIRNRWTVRHPNALSFWKIVSHISNTSALRLGQVP